MDGTAVQIAGGQGTIALELLAEIPATARLTLFVPVGGGGLISGAAPPALHRPLQPWN